MVLRSNFLYVCLILCCFENMFAGMRYISARMNQSLLQGATSIARRKFVATPPRLMIKRVHLNTYQQYMPLEDAQSLLGVSHELTFKELNDKSLLESQKVQQLYQDGTVDYNTMQGKLQQLQNAYELLHSILKSSELYKQQQAQKDLQQQPVVLKEDLRQHAQSIVQQQKKDDRRLLWQRDWVAHEQVMHSAYRGEVHSFIPEQNHY